jgi:hypothetical protein
MASPPRTPREEERRVNLRTLVIASAASASAALVTSRLWIAGTWLAAALTPVLVTLVSELLSRPTERLARTLTSDSPALPDPEAPARRVAERLRADAPVPDPDAPGPGARQAGAPQGEPPLRGAPQGEPPLRDPLHGEPAYREAPHGDALRPEAPVRIYRTEPARPQATRRTRIAFRAVFVTAALAFAIGVLVLTVPELIAGSSFGKSDGRTTLFSSNRKKDTQRNDSTPTTTDQTDTTGQTDTTTTPTDTTTTPTNTSTTPTNTTTTPTGTQTTPTTTSP